MTDQQKAFLALSKEYEELKDQMKAVQEQLDLVLADPSLGEGAYVQDPATLVVYKVVKPEGRFVYYRALDYVRTAFEGEKRGSLSKKEAEEAGFVLKA